MSDASSRLGDTYVAALRHGLSDPGDATLVGVVRRPTRRFAAAVDENASALAPPEDLLEEMEARRDDFGMRGMCAEEAHNAAFDAVDFASRYRDHLETEAARTATDALESRLRDGESLWLVCRENAAKKRCHRTILRAELESRLG